MNLRTVTRGDAALAFAALLLLIASFLPFYSVDISYGALGGSDSYSVNAWSLSRMPLLPAVFLLGIIGVALVLGAKLLPAEPRPAGIQLSHWGVVLTVAAFWSALWSLLSAQNGLSLGIGAYLGFLADLLAAALVLAGPMVPALALPLTAATTGQMPPAGYPQGQQGGHHFHQPVQQAQPGQPFHGPQAGQTGGYGYPAPNAAQPVQGGYGYPQQGGQTGQPFGAPAQEAAPTPAPAPAPAPAPTPQDAPPERDHATAMLTPVVKPDATAEPKTEPKTMPLAEPKTVPLAEPKTMTLGEPKTVPEPKPEPKTVPEPAPAFAPFWFAVPAARALSPEQGPEGSAPVGELVPGTWYLAIAQRGDALVTQTQEGKRGLLTDTSGIQRG